MTQPSALVTGIPSKINVTAMDKLLTTKIMNLITNILKDKNKRKEIT